MGSTIQNPMGSYNIVDDDAALGQRGDFPDKDFTNRDLMNIYSGNRVHAIFVKNSLGGVLTPGKGYTFKSGKLGTEVDALSGANLVCHGIADPYIVGTIPANACFWLIIKGPTKVMIGAGDQTINGVVQTLAAGVFGTGAAGTNPIGHSGIALAAGTSGNLCRAYFNSPFAPIQPVA
jgi:hypothetical protein